MVDLTLFYRAPRVGIIHALRSLCPMKDLYPCLLTLLLLPMLSAGQDRILLGGVLSDHLTGEPIMAAHVMNLTDSLATISNSEGAFRIPVHAGDSLVFTSIGYHSKALIITEKELEADFIEVRMVQRDYQLAEVEVNPLGTKAQFRKKFMELEVDDGTIEIIGVRKPTAERRTVPITEDRQEIRKAKYLFTNPASFLYGNLSRDARKRQQLHRLEREKKRHRYNHLKFNEDVVGGITGYSDAELAEFMAYCNFSEQDIYRTTEYELAVMILNRQHSFERISEDAGIPVVE